MTLYEECNSLLNFFSWHGFFVVSWQCESCALSTFFFLDLGHTSHIFLRVRLLTGRVRAGVKEITKTLFAYFVLFCYNFVYFTRTFWRTCCVGLTCTLLWINNVYLPPMQTLKLDNNVYLPPMQTLQLIFCSTASRCCVLHCLFMHFLSCCLELHVMLQTLAECTHFWKTI